VWLAHRCGPLGWCSSSCLVVTSQRGLDDSASGGFAAEPRERADGRLLRFSSLATTRLISCMGQLVSVVEKQSATPGVLRFEANRSLTGMGHERFRSVLDATGPRPAAELARRLFGTGRVQGVHVYGNMITVDVEKGYDGNGLRGVIENLYQYWKPGMVPPAFEDLMPAEEASAPAASGPAGDGAAALSEAAKRVPAHLLERSRLAREKWKASQGG
jgi:hypothetical protein